MQAELPIYQDNDCSVIVVSNLTNCSYNEAVDVLRFFGRKDGDGCYDETICYALMAQGYRYRKFDVRPAKTIKSLTKWWTAHKRWMLRGPFNLMVTTHDHVFCYIGCNKLDLSLISDLSRIENVWLVNKKPFQKNPEKDLTTA